MKAYQLKNYARNFVNVVMKDPGRKGLPRMLAEYLVLVISDPDTANQYFTKFLYRKGVRDYKRFVVPDRILYHCWAMNDPKYNPLVSNKYLFEKYFTRYGIPVVSTRSYNHNTIFFYGDEMIRIDTPEEFIHFLLRLFDEVIQSEFIIIKKKEGSSGGNSVFKIGRDGLKAGNHEIENVFNQVISSEYIIQDFVQQHESIRRINPSCLNTIRMDSFTNRDGVSRVYSAFLRMGKANVHVDNVGRGGIYVAVDLKTGKLNPVGWSDFNHGKAINFTCHPDSGHCFEGVKIPYFREAVEEVCRAAELVPKLRILGWDVAITPGGPVIIEANECPGITHSEVANGGFYDNLVFREVLEEIVLSGKAEKSRGSEISMA